MGELLWNAVWQFPIKLNINLPFDPVISVLLILKRNENV